ncbi:hypothetical protein GCM10010493_06160 [Streptomyces lavendulae subsp. grasserius]
MTLTLAPPASRPPAAHTALAYRCEAVATDLQGSREVLLATYRATTPRLAARWVRAEALRLVRLLCPQPESPSLRNAPLVVVGDAAPRPDLALLGWTANDAEYERTISALGAGDCFLLGVNDYDARYTLNVYPLPTRNPIPTAPPTSALTRAAMGRHRRISARRAV